MPCIIALLPDKKLESYDVLFSLISLVGPARTKKKSVKSVFVEKNDKDDVE